jgi:serine/threonine-protein phosphatase 5
VHGGPPVASDATLDQMRRIDRNREPPEDGPMCEMLWNDPMDAPGMMPNKVSRAEAEGGLGVGGCRWW